MKNLIKTCLSLLIIINLTFAPIADASFKDLTGSSYASEVQNLADRKLIEGYSDGTFRPYQAINRAEFLKLIMSGNNTAAPSGIGNCFSDVTNQWFAPYICKAVQMGIVQGYPDKTFRPGQSINIVEAFSIATKAFQMPVAAAKPGEAWFEQYVDYYHNNNIFSKFSYDPGRAFTREETAHLLYNILLYKEGKINFGSVRNAKSSGCGLNAPSGAPNTFNVNGVTRSAAVYVPSSYNKNVPVSLIFAFHGRTTSNTSFQRYVGLDRASGGKAIVIYPAGTSAGSSSYNWTLGKDYTFFDTMLAEYTSKYCINTDEIHIVGHSLGAWFANNLACVRGNVIRGAATIAGGRAEKNCNGPVAAMVWHNPQDNLTAFSQGENSRNLYIKQNSCSMNAVPTSPPSGNCILYQGCNEFAPVVWCPHTTDTYSGGQYTPHTWPRGTGQYMWDFFQQLKD
ncbi:MAG: S-layer homology domain-containing protein [Candidatus Gracilibacteria bacterium]